MNSKQTERIRTGKGFLAALDQSGGSTPKAVEHYGILRNAYTNDEEMFDLVHQMRTRILTSPSFTDQYILGAILFEQTMDRKVEGQFTADYLWKTKGIVPFLKVDQGLAPLEGGVQRMGQRDVVDEGARSLSAIPAQAGPAISTGVLCPRGCTGVITAMST